MASSFEPVRHALRAWEQAHPANLGDLEEQVDELSSLVKRFAAVVQDRGVIDDLAPQFKDLSALMGKLKETELKRGSEEIGRGSESCSGSDFTKACHRVQHIFQSIQGYIDRDEKGLCHSLIKIIQAVSSENRALNKSEKEEICLFFASMGNLELRTQIREAENFSKLGIDAALWLRVIDALIPAQASVVVKNMDRFFPSEEIRFIALNKLIEKCPQLVDLPLLKFSSAEKRHALLYKIAKYSPENLTKAIEHFGISDEKQIFELMASLLRENTTLSGDKRWQIVGKYLDLGLPSEDVKARVRLLMPIVLNFGDPIIQRHVCQRLMHLNINPDFLIAEEREKLFLLSMKDFSLVRSQLIGFWLKTIPFIDLLGRIIDLGLESPKMALKSLGYMDYYLLFCKNKEGVLKESAGPIKQFINAAVTKFPELFVEAMFWTRESYRYDLQRFVEKSFLEDEVVEFAKKGFLYNPEMAEVILKWAVEHPMAIKKDIVFFTTLAGACNASSLVSCGYYKWLPTSDFMRLARIDMVRARSMLDNFVHLPPLDYLSLAEIAVEKKGFGISSSLANKYRSLAADEQKELYPRFSKLADLVLIDNPQRLDDCTWLNSKDFLDLAAKAVALDGIVLRCVREFVSLHPGMQRDFSFEIQNITALAVKNNPVALIYLPLREKVLVEKLADLVFEEHLLEKKMLIGDDHAMALAPSIEYFLNEIMEMGIELKPAYIKQLYVVGKLSLKSSVWLMPALKQLMPAELYARLEKASVKTSYALREKDYVHTHPTERLLIRSAASIDNMGDLDKLSFFHALSVSLGGEAGHENRSLDFIRDPVNAFKKMQAGGLPPDDLYFPILASLIEGLGRGSLSETAKNDEIEKLAPALRWLGCWSLECQVKAIPVEKLNLPLVKKIFELQNPQMRYALSRLLFSYAYPEVTGAREAGERQAGEGEVKGEQEGKEKKEDAALSPLRSTPTSSKATISQQLLALCSRFTGVDQTPFMKMFSHPKYNEGQGLGMSLQFLIALLNWDAYEEREKGELLFAILTSLHHTPPKAPEDVLAIFNMVTALVNLGEVEKLKSLFLGETLRDPKKAVFNLLKVVFAEKTGLGGIELLESGFQTLLGNARQPLAILTYTAKLQQLPASEREATMTSMSEFVKGVMHGTYPNMRYLTESNLHLARIFASKPQLRREWIKGAEISASALLAESAELPAVPAETPQQRGFNALHQRVCLNDHFKDLRSLETPFYLEQCLLHPAESQKLRSELNSAMGKAAVQSAENPGTAHHNQTRSLLKLQQLLLNAVFDRKTAIESTKTACLNLVDKFWRWEGSKDTVKSDIVHCLSMLEAAEKTKAQDFKGYAVCDSDDWQDLLLCGTEVSGSCQSIHGSPDYSKCLLGYMMDGKIRIISIKDKAGRIVARQVMRLMWNEHRQSPVLYQEVIYHNPGVADELLHALQLLARKRAQTLNIPLVSGQAKTLSSEAVGIFPGGLSSSYSPAPFEYVDAAGIRVTQGVYAIPADELRILFQPKAPGKQEAMRDLRMRLCGLVKIEWMG